MQRTGTARLTQACLEHGLPEPVFEATPQRFTVTFSKDTYTEEHLRELGLSERQVQAVLYVKEHGSIDNSELQQLTGVTKRTVSRDLRDLEARGILHRIGQTGKGTRYELPSPRLPGSPEEGTMGT